MELNFRKLRADEINARKKVVTKGGVVVLLYKKYTTDMIVLDETVGKDRWSNFCTESTCTIRIKDDAGNVIAKSAVSDADVDAFQRAATLFGIGRELYTAPRIFIKKECLESFGEYGSEKGSDFRCNDVYSVNDIVYDGDAIASVTIGVSYCGKQHHELTFSHAAVQEETKASTPNPEPKQEPSVVTPAQSVQSVSDEDLAVMLAKASIAGTSKDGILAWANKQFGNVSSLQDLTEAQYVKLCACLDKQIAKKKQQEGVA